MMHDNKHFDCAVSRSPFRAARVLWLRLHYLAAPASGLADLGRAPFTRPHGLAAYDLDLSGASGSATSTWSTPLDVASASSASTS